MGIHTYKFHYVTIIMTTKRKVAKLTDVETGEGGNDGQDEEEQLVEVGVTYRHKHVTPRQR